MGQWIPKTIGKMVDEAAQMYPDREFIVIGQDRISYSKLKEVVDQLAKGFLSLGIKPREKVALWLPNVLPWVYSMFAISKIGAIFVPVNTRFKVMELEYLLKQSDSSALILPDEFLKINYVDLVYQLCSELKRAALGKLDSPKFPLLKTVVCTSDKSYPGLYRFNEILALGKEINLEPIADDVRPEQTVIILYTSGSTGFPKGVMLTHNNILRNGFEIGERLGLRKEDHYLNPCPLYHNSGLVNGILATLTHGCCLFTIPFFDAEACLKIIDEEKCTAILGIQTMFLKMLESPNFKSVNLSSLRTGLTTGTPQTVRDLYEKMGVRKITNVFGISEASPVCSISDCENDPLETRISKMGKPLPEVEMKIIHPQTGEMLKPNEKGEICVRGWNIMKGYYKNAGETAKTIDPEGWLHTGDLGSIDENGYVFFAGRIKNIVRVGGENVSPEEVEDFIYKNPKIQQVEIVGIPDAKYGEAIVAYIELKEGMKATGEEIIDSLRGQIANFKIPKIVKFIKDWPMTGSGKVQKFKLKEMAMENLRK